MELQLIVRRRFLLRLVYEVEPTLAFKEMEELADQLLELTRGPARLKCLALSCGELRCDVGERLGVDIVKGHSFGLARRLVDQGRDVEVCLEVQFKGLQIVINDLGDRDGDWKDLGRRVVLLVGSLDELKPVHDAAVGKL